jgi:hypothetical protein
MRETRGRVEAELAEEVPQARVCGVARDDQALCDLPVRHPFRHERSEGAFRALSVDVCHVVNDAPDCSRFASVSRLIVHPRGPFCVQPARVAGTLVRRCMPRSADWRVAP